jgi:hypothetical protein
LLLANNITPCSPTWTKGTWLLFAFGNNANATNAATACPFKLSVYTDAGSGAERTIMSFDYTQTDANLVTEPLKIDKLDVTGSLGVGMAATPQATLDVGGAGLGTASAVEARVGNASGDSTFRIGQDNTHHAYLHWAYNATPGSAYLDIATYGGNNNIVMQGAGGNVGIGVAPGVRLDVLGGIRMQGGNQALAFNNGSVETHITQVAGATGALLTDGGFSAVRFGVSGSAPTCSSTGLGTGGSPGCAIATGSTDSAGMVVLTTGSGSTGSTGLTTITFSATFGSASPICVGSFNNDGGTSWASGSTVTLKNASTASVDLGWTNAVAGSAASVLTASTTYRLNYICVGR